MTGGITRAPNVTKERLPPGQYLQFQPNEFAILQHNAPGASGVLGGYAKEENWLIQSSDPTTLIIHLDPTHLERIIRYILNYEQGGPNGRIRKACTPALARIGIHLKPPGKS